MISVRVVRHPISMIPGVWRLSTNSDGFWMLATHRGQVAIFSGDVVLKLGHRTWVWHW